MKEKIISFIIVALSLISIGSCVFAADGDLIVNGNVAIGTTRDPVTKLEVVSTDSTSQMSYPGTLRLLSSAPQIDFVDSDHNEWAIHVNSNRMYFIRQPWNTTDLVLDGGGKVGFGTAIPDQRMHVYSSGADNHVLSDVAGGDTYDPLFTLRIVGETVWNMGIDASDGNKFKIANGGYWNNLPTGTKFTIDNTNGNVGIGTSSPGAKLDIVGGGNNTLRIRAAGSSTWWDIFHNWGATDSALVWLYNGNYAAKLTNAGWWTTSDLDLKENIQPIDNPLGIVRDIRGVSYSWKDPTRGEGLQVGVIAQEVESVFPQAVNTEKDGLKTINYSLFVPLLIEALKEQQREIDTLKAELSAIRR